MTVPLLRAIKCFYFIFNFNPNQSYPATPSVPKGTPVAIPSENYQQGRILDPIEYDQVEFYFQLGRHGLPNACSKCLDSTQPLDSVPLLLGKRLTSYVFRIDMPFCKSCKQKQNAKQTLISISILLICSAVTTFFLWSFPFGDYWWIIAMLMMVVYGFIGIEIGTLICRPTRARMIDWPRGVIKMVFPNKEFQQEFITLNSRIKT